MKIGFTSTIPVEAVFAAGHTPVDLNNIFVMSGASSSLVTKAKMEGFPDTTCSWICGLYSTALEAGIDALIGVSGGDCSETIALMELLGLKGLRIIPFGYPHLPNPNELKRNIERLASDLGCSMTAVAEWKEKLDSVRAYAAQADLLLWKENKAWGDEVRLIQLSCTDFEGDADVFGAKCKEKVAAISQRPPLDDTIRLAVCGVPPIITDFYSVIERNGCRVVLSEVERQFSLPYGGEIQDAYSQYTYPYGMTVRARDILREIDRRQIDGVIHYVQSFCFRGIEDIALRSAVSVPILTLQGDLPSRVTETMEIRIEAFIDMLTRRKKKLSQ